MLLLAQTFAFYSGLKQLPKERERAFIYGEEEKLCLVKY